MPNNGSKYFLTVQSTWVLLIVLFCLFSLKWILVNIGAWVSDFEGELKIGDDLLPVAVSEYWNWRHVLWIYLFPYIGFVVIYTFLSLQRRISFNISRWLLLLRGWAFLLIIIIVFFMPLLEIMSKQGIYYALSWLYIDRSIQFIIGTLLWFYFMIRVFRVSSLFSSCMIIPHTRITSPSFITNQLIYLWYLPVLIVTVIKLVVTKFALYSESNFLVAGILLIILTNTWLIRKYKVIV